MVRQGNQDGRQDSGDRKGDGHIRKEGNKQQQEREYAGDAQHQPGADAQVPKPRGLRPGDSALRGCSNPSVGERSLVIVRHVNSSPSVPDAPSQAD